MLVYGARVVRFLVLGRTRVLVSPLVTLFVRYENGPEVLKALVRPVKRKPGPLLIPRTPSRLVAAIVPRIVPDMTSHRCWPPCVLFP